MSKKQLIEILKTFTVTEREDMQEFSNACRYAENTFENIMRSKGYGGIASFHESLLIGIEAAVEKISKNSYISQEDKDNQINYLNILKSKIEKIKDLLVLL